MFISVTLRNSKKVDKGSGLISHKLGKNKARSWVRREELLLIDRYQFVCYFLEKILVVRFEKIYQSIEDVCKKFPAISFQAHFSKKIRNNDKEAE